MQMCFVFFLRMFQ